MWTQLTSNNPTRLTWTKEGTTSLRRKTIATGARYYIIRTMIERAENVNGADTNNNAKWRDE